MTSELTHACHDRALVLAPGLFRSIARGARGTRRLDLTYPYRDREALHIAAPTLLGADDLRVLQALVALGGPTGVTLRSTPRTPLGERLRSGLALTGTAANANALVVRGSLHRLIVEAGYRSDSGSVAQHVRRCLGRLASVSVSIECGPSRQGFSLISWDPEGNDQAPLCVGLNPRLTRAIERKDQYTRIDLGEARRLNSDVARLLHQRLCGIVDPKKAQVFKVQTLLTYPWADPQTSPSQGSKRKAKLRKALADLQRVGWTVEDLGQGRVRTARPAGTLAA